MQPNTDTIGEVKSNGAPAVPSLDANGKGPEGISATDMGQLLHALQAVRVGDFSVRMASAQVGIVGKIADTFNEIAGANQRMASQLERVGQVVGREGKTRQRVHFGLTIGGLG